MDQDTANITATVLTLFALFSSWCLSKKEYEDIGLAIICAVLSVTSVYAVFGSTVSELVEIFFAIFLIVYTFTKLYTWMFIVWLFVTK